MNGVNKKASEAGTSEAGTSEAGTSEAGTSEADTSEAKAKSVLKVFRGHITEGHLPVLIGETFQMSF